MMLILNEGYITFSSFNANYQNKIWPTFYNILGGDGVTTTSSGATTNSSGRTSGRSCEAEEEVNQILEDECEMLNLELEAHNIHRWDTFSLSSQVGLSTYRYNYPSIYIIIYLSVCVSINLSIILSFYLYIYLFCLSTFDLQ